MATDKERWAEALNLCELKGGRALAYADERLGFLTRYGSEAEIARFRQIRICLEQMQISRDARSGTGDDAVPR